MFFSEEHRRKLSEAKKGKPLSEIHKKHMSEALKGRKPNVFTDEYRMKLSESKKGKPLSEEHKKHMSESLKGRKSNVFTEEYREKLSKAKKGKSLSEEHKKHMSESLKGRKMPPFTKEHRKNIGDAHRGEKSGCWKGGISFEPYCPKFNNEFRERVRAFFGYKCQKCGHVWQEGERKLAVHHVNYQKDSCCNQETIPLFVPVCSTGCHAKTNYDREKWEKHFTDLINKKFGGKCYFTKEEMKK
jgi:hypothetical protein